MFDWWSMLRIMTYWFHAHMERFPTRRVLWHPSRLKFYGYYGNSAKKSRLNRRRARRSILPMLAYATVSRSQSQVTAHASTESGPLFHRFDSDSRPWLIDNCLTACISNNKSDFVGKLHTVNTQVKGIGGPMMVTLRGTLKWSIEDDQGATHTFLIPDSYYAPSSPVCLFSPQHWAQTSPFQDNPKRNLLIVRQGGPQKGTWASTYDDSIELHWDHNKYHRTIPLDKATNVGKLYTAPGAIKFRVYQATFEANYAQAEPVIYTSAHLTPDDDEPIPSTHPNMSTHEDPVQYRLPTTTEQHNNMPPITGWPFHDTTTSVPIDTGNAEDNITPTAELLHIHYQLSHLPFSAIQLMAKNGHLPKRLVNCRVPHCAACLYGKATKRPWRNKPSTSTPLAKIKVATAPGQCISVDQMASPSPGLIAQLKGIPTTRRYTTATIFVDHFSRLSYVHLQQTTNGEETLQAKHAFENYAKTHGVSIRHYHCDNGRFADKLFIDDVRAQRQHITFCGVNAHFQNGIAERKIRELQELTRTSLLHATARWPRAINTHLWPYALRTANDVIVNTPKRIDGKTALGVFSGTPVIPKLNLLRPFGCPVYVLHDKLQGNNHLSKWNTRARVGIYLGISPLHARSVALVLNTRTGLVSPQFHVKFDDMFETVMPPQASPPIQWQSATHFVKRPTITIPPLPAEPSIPPIAPPDTSPELTHVPFDSPTDDSSSPSRDLIDIQGETDAATTKGATKGRPPKTTEEVRWSARHKPSLRLRESISQGLLSFTSTVQDIDGETEYALQEEMSNPIAYAASADKDTMYMHQAMRQPDKKQFIQAMVDEVTAHTKNGHWKIIPRSQVPEGTKVLPSVWSMKRKRRILTREVYKWKARLNLHGGKQELGINYWETYAATLSWPPIRFMLTVALMKGWCTRQIDFTLAYPQAAIECDMYMEIPLGFSFNGSRKTHVLLLIKNLYGQKQAGRTWQQHLNKGLLENDFVPSRAEECVWYRGKVTFMYYVDDGIFIGPCDKEIDKIIMSLQRTFNLTDEGDLSDYLGIKVTQLQDNKISLTQPHLIDDIIRDMKFAANTKPKVLPASSSMIIQRDLDGPEFDEHWDYRSVIGKLNFLEKSTRPDIAYAVHQCARFSANPKKSHANAVKQIVRYLIGTRDKGIIIAPTGNEFEVYCDSNFVGDYNKDTSHYDVMTAKSRGGHIIMYAGCPIVWSSKMLTEVTLSTTESEYCEISNALRATIPLMNFVKEIRERHDKNLTDVPVVKCEVFEDNSGAVELSMVHKMRPRTKHINVKYHHFREHVRKKLIKISHIPSENNCADTCTKPLGQILFEKHRLFVQGW